MQTHLTPPSGQSRPAGAPLEVLSFRLGAEEYGVGIEYVLELRSYSTVTAIANAPEYMKGVVNLRGVIVPILDLRIKFGLGNVTYDPLTVVIIFSVDGRQVGAVVDSVSDVVTLAGEQIKAMPQTQAAVDDVYVTGVGTLDERMLILIDIARLLSASLGTDTAAA